MQGHAGPPKHCLVNHGRGPTLKFSSYGSSVNFWPLKLLISSNQREFSEVSIDNRTLVGNGHLHCRKRRRTRKIQAKTVKIPYRPLVCPINMPPKSPFATRSPYEVPNSPKRRFYFDIPAVPHHTAPSLSIVLRRRPSCALILTCCVQERICMLVNRATCTLHKQQSTVRTLRPKEFHPFSPFRHGRLSFLDVVAVVCGGGCAWACEFEFWRDAPCLCPLCWPGQAARQKFELPYCT